jgi:hypothetical protein
MKALLSLFFIFSSATYASSTLDLQKEISGRYLSVKSFDLHENAYLQAKCSKQELKDKTFNNLISPEKDDAIILMDDLSCSVQPAFNIISIELTSSDDAKIFIGEGRGKIPGLFSRVNPDDAFKVTSIKRITTKCSLKKHGVFQLNFGTLTCKANQGSEIVFIVK